MQACYFKYLISLKMYKHFALVLLLISSSFAFGQNGIIRGKVIDDVTGEALRGVTINVAEASASALTDLDGNFSISVSPGNYSMVFSFVSYATIHLPDVKVTPGEVTLLENLRMTPESKQIEGVTVTARQTRASETALQTIKRRSPIMMDGVSADKISLIGDANAGAAAKRVTGVSVEDGKYVYIRGLGDRYSKTTLNGMDIPGLDPDKNSLQLDIFPSNLIDNILVSKNFVPELPADFAGGLMNIEIKDFPTRKSFDISLGMSVNPSMHFNSNYLSYKGGKTDFLGFDDGTRALPKGARSRNIPSPVSGASSEQVTSFVKSFDPTLGASRTTSLFDYDFGISGGNQIALKGNKNRTLGYVFSLSYKTNYTYYKDLLYGEYQNYIDPTRFEMRYATIQDGELGERNNMLGAMAGLAYKTTFSKYRLNAMHLQNGTSKAGIFDIQNDGEAVGQSGYIAKSNVLEYNQRSLTNILLNGVHTFDNPDWEVDWRISPTYSTSFDPDIRKTAFTYTNSGEYTFSAGAGGSPSRIWRSLKEMNLPVKVDIIKKYRFQERDAKLKFGLSNIYKHRDYEILMYNMRFFTDQNWSTDDPNSVLTSANIYPNSPNSVYYQSGNSVPNSNEYQSSIINTGAYVSNEMALFHKLRAIFGVRGENYLQFHTGRDQRYANGDTENGKNLDNARVLNSLKFFPSVNLIYALTSNQNLRTSYYKTVARPSFKEMSFAQILDPISNRIFNGGLFTYPAWDGNLIESDINNFDLRWELFMPSAQIFSVSGFAKTFKNPIELVRIPEQQTSTEYQPRNVGSGLLYGAEVEFRKNFDFISDALENFSINGNFTYVKSSIEMTDVEFNSRKLYEKQGETIDRTRDMAGQAPYVINAGLSYSSRDNGIDAGLFYNVKGPVLYIVGGGLFPDIYQSPFHSLNFSFAKKITKNLSADFKVSNILDSKMEKVYRSFNAQDQLYESYSLGRAFGLGLNYKF